MSNKSTNTSIKILIAICIAAILYGFFCAVQPILNLLPVNSNSLKMINKIEKHNDMYYILHHNIILEYNKSVFNFINALNSDISSTKIYIPNPEFFLTDGGIFISDTDNNKLYFFDNSNQMLWHKKFKSKIFNIKYYDNNICIHLLEDKGDKLVVFSKNGNLKAYLSFDEIITDFFFNEYLDKLIICSVYNEQAQIQKKVYIYNNDFKLESLINIEHPYLKTIFLSKDRIISIGKKNIICYNENNHILWQKEFYWQNINKIYSFKNYLAVALSPENESNLLKNLSCIKFFDDQGNNKASFNFPSNTIDMLFDKNSILAWETRNIYLIYPFDNMIREFSINQDILSASLYLNKIIVETTDYIYVFEI